MKQHERLTLFHALHYPVLLPKCYDLPPGTARGPSDFFVISDAYKG